MFKRLFVYLVLVGTFVPLLYINVNIGEHIIASAAAATTLNCGFYGWRDRPQPLLTVMPPRANNE